MKEQFTLPQNSAFTKGKRDQSFTLRIHEALLKEYKKLAERNGCSTTDVILHALNEYAQWARSKKSK